MRPVFDMPRAPHRRSILRRQARLNFRLGEDARHADFRKGSFGGQAPPFVGVALSFLLFLLLPNAAVSAGIHAEAVIAGTNAIRAAQDRPTLRTDAALAAAAQQRAEELAASAAFDHVRPSGAPFSTAVAEAQYPFERVAENLAIDYLNESPLLDGWLGSKSHRRTLLSAEYAHIGVGVAAGVVNGRPTVVTVQLLGRTQSPELRGWSRLTSALPVG